MIGAIFSYAAPLLVSMIIEFFKDPEGEVTYGFKLLGVLICSQFIAYVVNEQMCFYQYQLGIKSSNALISMIYQKQLRLSGATNKKFGSGQIANFIQVDAYMITRMTYQMGRVAQMPILLMYCFIMLFIKLGLTFLTGIGVFLIGFATNLGIGIIQ